MGPLLVFYNAHAHDTPITPLPTHKLVLAVVAKKGGIFQLQLPSGTRVTLQGSGLLTATRRNAQDAVSIG